MSKHYTLKEHTLWTPLIWNMSVANNNWFYRNRKYLGLEVLQYDSASSSIWGSVFSISLCWSNTGIFTTSGGCRSMAIAPLSRQKWMGRGINSLPNLMRWLIGNADDSLHDTDNTVILQRCPHSSCWSLWIHYFTRKREFATVIEVKDLDMQREFWIIPVSPT